MSSLAEKQTYIRQQRDEKTQPHLAQYAPVWIVHEEFFMEEDSIFFDVVFLHPDYRWVQRRYRYDAYNDVLYHKGQQLVDEAETYAMQDDPPYISSFANNTVNSYGG